MKSTQLKLAKLNLVKLAKLNLGYPGDITFCFNSKYKTVETGSDIPWVARGGYGTPEN